MSYNHFLGLPGISGCNLLHRGISSLSPIVQMIDPDKSAL
jgi:hypothetical protein